MIEHRTSEFLQGQIDRFNPLLRQERQLATTVLEQVGDSIAMSLFTDQETVSRFPQILPEKVSVVSHDLVLVTQRTVQGSVVAKEFVRRDRDASGCELKMQYQIPSRFINNGQPAVFVRPVRAEEERIKDAPSAFDILYMLRLGKRLHVLGHFARVINFPDNSVSGIALSPFEQLPISRLEGNAFPLWTEVHNVSAARQLDYDLTQNTYFHTFKDHHNTRSAFLGNRLRM